MKNLFLIPLLLLCLANKNLSKKDIIKELVTFNDNKMLKAFDSPQMQKQFNGDKKKKDAFVNIIKEFNNKFKTEMNSHLTNNFTEKEIRSLYKILKDTNFIKTYGKINGAMADSAGLQTFIQSNALKKIPLTKVNKISKADGIILLSQSFKMNTDITIETLKSQFKGMPKAQVDMMINMTLSNMKPLVDNMGYFSINKLSDKELDKFISQIDNKECKSYFKKLSELQSSTSKSLMLKMMKLMAPPIPTEKKKK